jgi:hypothetical protein
MCLIRNQGGVPWLYESHDYTIPVNAPIENTDSAALRYRSMISPRDVADSKRTPA